MADRDARLLRMFQVQPALSLKEAGRRLGLTRGPVRQILAKNGRRCIPSGLQRRKRSRLRHCKKDGCTRLCLKQKLYCPEHDSGLKAYTCQQCGRTFYQLRNQVENAIGRSPKGGRDGPFCSRQCLGAFTGKHYGWGDPAHPQRRGLVKRRSKFWDAICALLTTSRSITLPIKGNTEVTQRCVRNAARIRGLRVHTKQRTQPDGSRTLQVWLRKETT